jgi:branched-chain amino acid transport system permease protein
MLEVILQLTISAVLTGVIYALMAIGLNLIFGVVRVINLAHGEFLMLAMYLTYWVFRGFGLDPYLGILITVPVFFFIGIAVHQGILRHLLDGPEESQVIATFGLAFALRYGVALVWSTDHRSVTSKIADRILNIGFITIDYAHLIGAILSGMLIATLFIFLYHTYLGRAIRAIADQRTAAFTAGINVGRIYYVAIGLGLACVAFCGAVILPFESVFPTIGANFTLLCFVIVVLGGMGNLWGCLLGGIIIAFIEMMVAFFLAPILTTFAYFVLFLIVVSLRPAGLLGTRGRRI